MFKMFVQRLTGRFKGEIKNFPRYVRKPYNEAAKHRADMPGKQQRLFRKIFCLLSGAREGMEVISGKKKTRKDHSFRVMFLEPAIGFEPTTYALRMRRSTS